MFSITGLTDVGSDVCVKKEPDLGILKDVCGVL